MKALHTLFTATCALYLAMPLASAQKNDIDIDSVKVESHGAAVGLSFQMNVPQGTIKQNYDLYYIPVLISDNGELRFPAVAFSGSRKQLSNERKTTMGYTTSFNGPSTPGYEGHFFYDENAPYQRWLSKNSSTLVFDLRRDGYRKSVDLGRITLDEHFQLKHPWIIYTPPLEIPDTTTYTGKQLVYARASDYSNDGRYVEATQMLDTLIADEARAAALTGIWRMAADSALRTALFPKIGLGAEGERYTLALDSLLLKPAKTWDTVSVRLLFPVKDSTLDQNMKSKLDSIVMAVSTVKEREKLPRISITGAASPEGFQSLNRKLAWGRATAVQNYLLEQLALKGIEYPAEKIVVNSLGSDWNGLYQLVDTSDMPYREEVLELLRTTPEAERGHALWGLKWGVPYTYLYKHTFPKLRGATMVSLLPGTAADEVGEIINRAIVLIRKGDYAAARDTLLPYTDDPRATFPFAIACAMSGDFDMLSILTNMETE